MVLHTGITQLDNDVFILENFNFKLYTLHTTLFCSDVNNTEVTRDNQILCHFGAVYEVETIRTDPTCFLTCGEDGTVRWFDLRVQNKCKKRQCREVCENYNIYILLICFLNLFR